LTGLAAAAQLAALISIVVTVGLFTYTQVTTMRAGRSQAREAAVLEVLDALDRITRRRTWPTVARLWHKPELDYALLVPRLLVGLPKRDRAIATWLATQVNLMNAASTQNQVFKVALEASSRIANWHIGEVPTSWFESAVRAHSPRKPRGNLRVLMTSIAAAAGLIATGLTAGAVAGVGAGLAQLRVRKAADNG
jgi:hypothetical protein